MRGESCHYYNYLIFHARLLFSSVDGQRWQGNLCSRTRMFCCLAFFFLGDTMRCWLEIRPNQRPLVPYSANFSDANIRWYKLNTKKENQIWNSIVLGKKLTKLSVSFRKKTKFFSGKWKLICNRVKVNHDSSPWTRRPFFFTINS